MRAITIRPGQPDSVRVTDVPEPEPGPGQALLATLEVGVCGTDRDILEGVHGAPPAGAEVLIPGHECLARVLRAPQGSALAPGQLVVPIVRRPCGRPECYPCAADHADMCITLACTERGIERADGFQCARFTEAPHWLVPVPEALRGVGVLVEPASIMAKAVETSARIQRARLDWRPRTALVTGAGPVGLLGAMLLRLAGLEVTVYDRQPAGSVKARAVTGLGARYACADQTRLEDMGQFDWLLECTGAPPVVMLAMGAVAPDGVLCLLGVSAGDEKIPVAAAALNGRLVTTNALVFGSVNASREAFTQAVHALAAAEAAWPGWLGGLITRRVPPQRVQDAVAPGHENIKAVVDWAE